jgi:AraC family transcriptional regulator
MPLSLLPNLRTESEAPATRTKTFGDPIGRSFGLPKSPKLVTRSLRASQIALSRLSLGPEHVGMSDKVPAEDSFVMALYLTNIARHELWNRDKLHLSRGYAAHTIRIVNLLGEFRSHIFDPHETVVAYMPRSALDSFTDEHATRRIQDLRCEPGMSDAVVSQLTTAATQAFERPDEADALFVEHLILALASHLIRAYGGGPAPIPEKGRLSPAQARRAQDFMVSRCSDNISLAEVAKVCNLSRGHFIKAFRVTTGLTPHQWLQQRRVQLAQGLLLDTQESIAEIAAACGFSDQSHMTRVFAGQVGATPAAWRRQRRL